MAEVPTEKPASGGNNDNRYLAGGLGIGIAIGIAIGVALDNLAVGVVIGLVIGLAIGAGMEQSARHRGPYE